ncbi:MAG: PspC domain-containing protein [Acidimicrobiia bacterium]
MEDAPATDQNPPAAATTDAATDTTDAATDADQMPMAPPTATATVPPPAPAAPPAPPTPPAAPPTARELRRSRDRKLAGVCGGLAEYFGIDPVIVRLLFVGGAFMGLATVPVYIAAWFVMPDTPPAGLLHPRPQPGHDERMAA